MKIILIPENQFKLLAKLDRRKGRFYISISATFLEIPLVLAIKAESWSEAVQETRSMLYIMNGCMTYTINGTIDLPLDLSHLSAEIPNFVGFLQHQNDAINNN